MFDEVRDIVADGRLQYAMNFSISSSQPDSAVFESTMKKEKFRLRKYGSVNLMKMNGEFVQNVYERDRLVRSFMVGPSNPAYTPLDKISVQFINAVLTSEDGNFFFHNGFNEEAFRRSIIANFKAGRFVRGGSTITMQLVKNVFLTRKKTVARKAEEALLVWLIENNNLYSKERMLEVYLNIIELGPGIYGVGEAAPFYFGKSPSELTLPEGIFLASLLPHPKWFKYSFDTLGNLKPYLADYYRIVSDFMLRRELISQEEHDQLLPHITLNGPAREMIVPSDTIPADEEEDKD
jgi:membrane peptidoglycan carboxypeptidase